MSSPFSEGKFDDSRLNESAGAKHLEPSPWQSLFCTPESNKPGEKLPAAGQQKPEEKSESAHTGLPEINLACPDNVKCDPSGYATDIKYPGDKKSRHISRDSATHEALSLTTTTHEASGKDTTTTLANKGGTWFLTMQGMQLPVNGKLEVSKNGEVAIKTNGSDAWKVEKTDGTIVSEKENADGARVRLDASGQAVKIVRADGSSVEKTSNNTILESRPGQKPVTWTCDADAWKPDGGQAARKNLRLNEDGKLSFTDSSGFKHNIDGKNMETREGAGLASITADRQNRPITVDTGDKIRKYDYFDEKSNDVKSVTITNKKTGKSETHARDSKDSDQWSNTTWRGEIRVAADGVHSVRSHAYGQPVDDNARWESHHPDGRVSSDLIGKDGSRASYDAATNNLVGVLTGDGVRIDRVEDKGKTSIKYYNPHLGDTVSWTKGEDGAYRSDSSLYKEARSNLDFNAGGELTYTNDKGEKIAERKDGTRRVELADGTSCEYGADNSITKATRGQIERSFNRENGEIKSVIDRDIKANKETTVFDAKAAGVENFSHVHLAANGDLSYQKAAGSAVLEKANGLHLELDRDGDMTQARSDTSCRGFRYLDWQGKKALVAVSDQTDKGAGETFARVINPDGTLAHEFRSDKGSQSRYDIAPCAGGDYEYSTPGARQPQVARLPR